jgi:TatD DNase family protein
MFADSHAHLEMSEFDPDRDQAVDRALSAGVGLIATVGTNLQDCFKAVEIASRFHCVHAIIGIHPHEVKDFDPAGYETLKTLAAHNKVVAYGEIGLDFFRNLSPREIQIRHFEEQLEIADGLNLPIVIHDRDAHKETMDRLRRWPGERRGVIHCFSGDTRMAEECIEMGFYISVTGSVTFKKSEQLRQVVRETPIERLLIETDAPYLTPEPHRGKRNEPAYVILTARKIAEIKQIPTEEVGRITTENAKRVFNIK